MSKTKPHVKWSRYYVNELWPGPVGYFLRASYTGHDGTPKAIEGPEWAADTIQAYLVEMAALPRLRA